MGVPDFRDFLRISNHGCPGFPADAATYLVTDEADGRVMRIVPDPGG